MTAPEGQPIPVAGGFCHLDDLSVVSIAGSASRAFLSRQLTCSVTPLAPGRGLFGAWLTPKGRALALLHLVQGQDALIRAVLPSELADGFTRRLGMFVLREDVKLARTPDERVLGLGGDAVAFAAAHDDAIGMTTLPAAAPLALWIGTEPQTASLTAALHRTGSVEVASRAWDLALIRAGIPQVRATTQEDFVPQMLNLDLLGAISFDKGCYPGQEIVARTQHLGRIKRRTFIGRCEAPAPEVAVGDVLVGEPDGAAVGRVVASAADGDAWELLVVLPLDVVSAGAVLRLGGHGGPPVTITRPPYLADAHAS